MAGKSLKMSKDSPREKLARFVKEVGLILSAPILFVWRMFQSGLFDRNVKGVIMGLSPELNSINDHATIPCYSEAVKRYGPLGIQWDLRGAPMGLGHHPPLGKLICRVAGIRAYFLISMVLYVSSFLLLAILTDHFLPLLLLPYIFLSPYFKNNGIVTGRYDFMAWPFYMAAIGLFHHDQVVISWVAATIGALLHPSILVVGLFGFFAYGIVTPQTIGPILVGGFLLLITISFWMLPFYRSRRFTGLTKHSWNFGSIKDHTRDSAITAKKLAVYAPFVIATGLLSPGPMLAIALIPIIFLVLHFFRESLINRFAVEMLIIVSGALVIIEIPDVWLSATYLVAIYAYASPSKRTDFSIGIVSLSNSQIKTLKDVYHGLPDKTRILFLPYISNADDVRRYAKYHFMLMQPFIRTENQEFTTGSCFASGLSFTSAGNKLYFNINYLTPAYLKEQLNRFGINYFITFQSPFIDLIEGYGYQLVKSVDLSRIGSVAGIRLFLYKCPTRAAVIEPEVPLEYSRNDLFFKATESGWYHLKYIYFPAWRAYFNGSRISIKYNTYGMFVQVPAAGNVSLRFRHRHCFEKNYWAHPIEYDEVVTHIKSKRTD